jgi:hypothetical protein
VIVDAEYFFRVVRDSVFLVSLIGIAVCAYVHYKARLRSIFALSCS